MSRPRIRTIKPELWADEKVGRLSRDARLLFVGLITMADDEGRLRGMHSAILGHVFPYDQDAARKLDKWLAELELVSLIFRYQVSGVDYVEIPGWAKHQKVNRPSPSELPAPSVFTDRSVNGHGAITDPSRSVQ